MSAPRYPMSLMVAGTVSTASIAGAIVPYVGRIVKVSAWAVTAPTSATMILDCNINGTTIFTTPGNRVIITAGSTAVFSGTPEVFNVSAGDKITIDFDQVGSGVAGADVRIMVDIEEAR